MRSKPSVAILGGGVGGLSAAHELAERGFAVTVYEQRSMFGGKARSLSVAGSGTAGRADLPGEHGSTRTVGRILLQLFYGILIPGRVFDRLLAGPTNDVWIDPWRAHLSRLGVAMVPNAAARSFNVQGKRIASVSIERNGHLEAVTADFYVAAVPVEVMQRLSSPELVRAAPSLARLNELRTEWMNGIQFYLRTDAPLADGHAIYLDSNWALTSVSQRQFWRGYDLSTYGPCRRRWCASFSRPPAGRAGEKPTRRQAKRARR